MDFILHFLICLTLFFPHVIKLQVVTVLRLNLFKCAHNLFFFSSDECRQSQLICKLVFMCHVWIKVLRSFCAFSSHMSQFYAGTPIFVIILISLNHHPNHCPILCVIFIKVKSLLAAFTSASPQESFGPLSPKHYRTSVEVE